MGLGRMLTRAVQYQATNTVTGEVAEFTIQGNSPLSPDWSQGAYQGGMSVPGAWRAAVLLSDLLGGVPWHAYRERGDQPVEKLAPTPPMLEQPASPDTRVTTFAAMALDLIWHGNAIAIVADRDRNGWPTAFTPVPAEQVQVMRSREQDRLPFPTGSVVYVVGGQTFHSDDVVHVKGPSRPGSLRGMGVIECHLNGSLKLAGDLAKQAGGIADSAVPSVKITSDDPDLGPDEAEQLKRSFMRSQRTRQPVVVNNHTQIEALSWNPSETQLLDARKFSLHEVALIFGLPLSFLGADQATRTYSNVEQESLNLIKYSLGGHLARFEQALSLHLPRGTWAKANLDSILRGDTLTRYQAHGIAIERGFLTPDEVRALEDRPPLTPAQKAELKPPPPVAPRPAAEGDEDEDTEREATTRAREWAAEMDDHDRDAGNELEHYWKHGAGRKRWVGHPHPWTALYKGLRKHVGAARAKRIASQWFRDVFGIWPGERKGSNPVGKG